MAFTHKPNRGNAFKNNEKRPDRQDPDYQGDANIGGEDYRIAIWLGKTKNDETYISLAFTPKTD